MKKLPFELRAWAKFLLCRATGIKPSRRSIEDWDRQYAEGAWRGLEGIEELGHYSIIAGYARRLTPKTILDVGCGHGVLAGHLKTIPYHRYLGVDFSSEAIRHASEGQGDERTAFLAADARTFQREEKFDLIIFNECLYYLGGTRELVRKYFRSLAPNGQMIVSMFAMPGNGLIWSEAEQELRVEDAVTVANHASGGKWIVKLLAPRAAL